MQTPTLAVIVLASDGSNNAAMGRARPDPLRRLCGRPMISYVLSAVESVSARRVIVVVDGCLDRIDAVLADSKPISELVQQPTQGGDGAGVMAGLATLDHDLEGDDDIIIVTADLTLLAPDVLHSLVESHRRSGAAATMVTADLADHTLYPTGMRVVRGGRSHRIERVVEEPDLVGSEHDITETAAAIWCVKRSLLAAALRRLQPDSADEEIHLSGIIEVFATTGHHIGACPVAPTVAVAGVGDRFGLADVETELRRRINRAWLARGVTIIDPGHTYIDDTVRLDPDVTLLPGTILEGDTTIGDGCVIGPDSRIVDSEVGPGCRIEQASVCGSVIGPDCRVGPFAALGQGTRLAPTTITGPFYAAGHDPL